MSETVTVALISSGSVLFGVGISQFFELKKRKSQESRWYADYFLPKKFDAISNLYAQLQTTYGTTVYRHRKLKNDLEFQQLVVCELNSFVHRYHLASIYLTPGVNKKSSMISDNPCRKLAYILDLI